MKRNNLRKKLIGKSIPYRINTIWGRYDYWLLRRRVMKLWRYHHKQYHIVPLDSGNVTVMDNDFRKIYNRGVEKKNQITYYKLIQMAFFSTPIGNRLIA